MIINLKSIKGATAVLSLLVVVGGFVVGATRSTVQVTQTLERVNKTQEVLLDTNAKQHREFNGRLTDLERWQARREGYDAAMAERAAGN